MIFKNITETYKKAIIVATGNSLRDFDFKLLENLSDDIAIIQINGICSITNFRFYNLYKPTHWITIDPIDLFDNFLYSNNDIKKYVGVPEDFGTENARVISHRNRNIFENVHYLKRISNITELQEDKDKIVSINSSFAGLNLAYHFNVSKILLLGIDADSGYHYYDKIENTNTIKGYKKSISKIPDCFEKTLNTFKNIEIKNGSLISKINCYDKISPIEGLNWIQSDY